VGAAVVECCRAALVGDLAHLESQQQRRPPDGESCFAALMRLWQLLSFGASHQPWHPPPHYIDWPEEERHSNCGVIRRGLLGGLGLGRLRCIATHDAQILAVYFASAHDSPHGSNVRIAGRFRLLRLAHA